MINVFEQDYKIVRSADLDYQQIERVKQVESENKYLTYVLIAAGIVILGVITIIKLDQIRKEKA